MLFYIFPLVISQIGTFRLEIPKVQLLKGIFPSN